MTPVSNESSNEAIFVSTQLWISIRHCVAGSLYVACLIFRKTHVGPTGVMEALTTLRETTFLDVSEIVSGESVRKGQRGAPVTQGTNLSSDSPEQDA